ncbi:hypothetical protein CYCD_24760 [Tenuifilaceae bacterium CYCD]|nr:hypothetical protein CYCD_24760 [Tenuifilaceae bacterium CYCD]
MAYKKRSTSLEQEKAQNRLDGIKQFETSVNYGVGLMEEDYLTKINRVNKLTQEYNQLLTQADGIATQLDIAERELAEISKRFLNAVGAKYGYDSVEYEKAGGVRTSDYKRTSRKTNNNVSSN